MISLLLFIFSRLIECIVNAWKQRQEEHTEGCREQGGQDQEESEDTNHE